jgi:hypothetical protein
MRPLFGLGFEDLEDEILLAHAGGASDAELLGDLRELLDAHVLQLAHVQPGRWGFDRDFHFRRQPGLLPRQVMIAGGARRAWWRRCCPAML